MNVFKPTYHDQKGNLRKTAKWYVEFFDHRDKRHRIAAFTSKPATEEFGRTLEKLVCYHKASGGQIDPALHGWLTQLPRSIQERLFEYGLIDGRRAAVSLLLIEDLEPFARALKAKGTTAKHAELLKSRITRLLKKCGFQHWGDITGTRLITTLEAMRQGQEGKDGRTIKGIGAQTFNFYLQAIKQFCRWGVRERRIAESPVAYLTGLNPKMHRRFDRRALTAAELTALLDAAAVGRIHHGMSGPERALLYRLAVETGLRVAELQSLTPLSFDLSSDEPTVTVAAAYSKRRRQDTIPLLPELTDLLTKHVPTIPEGTPVFRVPDKPAEMLREDLTAARNAWLEQIEDPEERQRREKSDHLRYRTAAGVIDFHALRHTFITNLARGGVHPKLAQDLARHSDINLTMSRYSHTELAERAKALASLPGTKTAGNQPPEVLDEASSLGRRLRIKQRIQATSVDSGGPDGEKPDRAQVLAALEEVLCLIGFTEQPPAGFEPATCGLQNRCSTS